MIIGAETNIGRVRKTNEDAHFVGPNLLAVADGMGGHAAGEVASSTALERLAAWKDWSDPAKALDEAVQAANEAVLNKSLTNPAYAGMGTTLTAIYIANNRLYAAHVGDSRLYLYREQSLSCLTNDHSVVGELLRIGGLSKEEARVHPQRNVLTRALGTSHQLVVDIDFCDISDGDRLLLCTDGLHGQVSEDEIAETLCSEESPITAAQKFVSIANAAGGSDNITVIVADITEEDLV